jgi:hypothetical protein
MVAYTWFLQRWHLQWDLLASACAFTCVNSCRYTAGAHSADLYKLLLHEEGCYFRRHRDNERLAGCFGGGPVQVGTIRRCA